ncbi:egg cell-secreted protein 1.2-like [Malania oleifera]|uniref:egg cell-secreted protein 1.2-like n=1 Tax=Malania oleifera TaxID=397392 RepID=UPI0025AE407B|nr:egg cell-secreted protein 1.2-like [Malania oleifera]
MPLKTALLVLTVAACSFLVMSATTIRADGDDKGDSKGVVACFKALPDIKKRCKQEIRNFFHAGKFHVVSKGCCAAAGKVEYECWIKVLKAIGLQPKDGNGMRDQCHLPLPPAPAPAPAAGAS